MVYLAAGAIGDDDDDDDDEDDDDDVRHHVEVTVELISISCPLGCIAAAVATGTICEGFLEILQWRYPK